MPNECCNCRVSIRSGQQVLLCDACGILIHIRCLPVTADEGHTLTSSRWTCALCEARRQKARERSATSRKLDEMLGRVMDLIEEQEELKAAVRNSGQLLNVSEKSMDDLERAVSELRTLDKKLDDDDIAEEEGKGFSLTPSPSPSSSPSPPLGDVVLHFSQMGSVGVRRSNSIRSTQYRTKLMTVPLGSLISQLIASNKGKSF